jgi:hypothetical protein
MHGIISFDMALFYRLFPGDARLSLASGRDKDYDGEKGERRLPP